MPVMAEDVRHYCVQLAASAVGVGRTRRKIREVLSDWGLSDLNDVTELLLGELLTNVYVHVGPGAWHALTLIFDGDLLRVEVRDSSPRMPVRRVCSDEDAESGRGLSMVGHLSLMWGVDRLPPGKVVWFTLPYTGPRSRHHTSSDDPLEERHGTRVVGARCDGG